MTSLEASPHANGEVEPLGDAEYERLARTIESACGVFLPPSKRPLLVRRLQGRLRQLGLTSWRAYCRRIASESDRSELAIVLDRITTHETRFFREPRQFEFMVERVVPRWRQEQREGRRPAGVKVWSAACSTGEEAYSLAMLLRDHLPWWSIDVVASDVCREVLATAARATYSVERVGTVPSELARRYLRLTAGGSVTVVPAVRKLVRFRPLNLVTDCFRELGALDLILCRNVLMYFREETRLAVARALAERLVPGGLLFVGHAESLHRLGGELESLAPSIYRRPSQLPRRRLT